MRCSVFILSPYTLPGCACGQMLRIHFPFSWGVGFSFCRRACGFPLSTTRHFFGAILGHFFIKICIFSYYAYYANALFYTLLHSFAQLSKPACGIIKWRFYRKNRHFFLLSVHFRGKMGQNSNQMHFFN